MDNMVDMGTVVNSNNTYRAFKHVVYSNNK